MMFLATSARPDGPKSRQMILEAVLSHPGINRSQVCRLTGLGWGNVAHHVRTMKRDGELQVMRIGRAEHHFAPETRVHVLPILAVLAEDGPLEVLASMQPRAGHRIQELAEALGQSRKTVRRHLRALTSLGLVTESRHYRPLYFISARGLDTVRRGPGAPGPGLAEAPPVRLL
jgi:DNA-binding transcriptional ArsR family regulator